MSSASPLPSGTWTQRWLVRAFSVLFGILSYMLVAFLLEDIRDLPGPDYEAMLAERVPEDLRLQTGVLQKEMTSLQTEFGVQQNRQSLLSGSTRNAQTTMDQLLEFQRLSLDKGVTPSAEEQQALAESQQRFLANQTEYQRLNEQVVQLQERKIALEARQRAHDEELGQATAPVYEEFKQLSEQHEFMLAWAQLGVLIPLLVLGMVLFYRNRESPYVSLYLALAVAMGAKALRVILQHFPAEFFRYVLVVTFLVIVIRAVIVVVRSITHPRQDVLLRRFREAYETFLCPICDFPIRRGPRKHLYWTRRTVKKLALPTTIPAEPERAYCCPSCSTQLFVECPECHAVRHSLLPTCEHCGTGATVAVTA